MPDRIIREDLLESDRWLDLPTDTHRLVYQSMLLKVDDFANIEGGRRLWRFVCSFTQVKSEEDFHRLMSDLQDVDLVRRYEVGECEFWHVPRFKNHRRYTTRKHPKSPWCDATQKTTIEKLQEVKKKTAAGLRQTDGSPPATLARGVGVGVGVGVGENPPYPPSERGGGETPISNPVRKNPKTDFAIELPPWLEKSDWDDFVKHRATLKAPLTERAANLALAKLGDLRAQGSPPERVIQESIISGYKGLFPVRLTDEEKSRLEEEKMWKNAL